MLKMVLLPQPDGPIRLTKRPAGTASVTSASAVKTPDGASNIMLTPSMRSFVGEAKAASDYTNLTPRSSANSVPASKPWQYRATVDRAAHPAGRLPRFTAVDA